MQMQTELSRALRAKLDHFMAFSDAEAGRLETLPVRMQTFEARRTLIHEGEHQRVAYVVIEGWGCRFKSLANGEHQVVGFPLPGDFLGLRSTLFHVSDLSCMSLSPLRVAVLEPDILWKLFETEPRVGMAFLWSMARDEAVIVEHLTSIGQRSSLAAMAHFFLETLDRLKMIGREGQNNSFACPVNQEQLADALGISNVHVNRILRELRERQLVTFQGSVVIIHDIEALSEIAGYEGSYLDGKAPGLPY